MSIMTLEVLFMHSKHDVIHALDCLCLNNGYGYSHVLANASSV